MASFLTKTGEDLKALGIGSAVLALLYAGGFFVRLGESHLLGVSLPVTSQLDYLTLGGDFLFSTLQALAHLPRLIVAPAPWLAGVDLPGKLVAACALLALTIATRSLRHWARRRTGARFRHLRTALLGVDLLAAVGFALVWLGVLQQPLAYRDMLFPLKPETLSARRAFFDEKTVTLDLTTGSDARRREQLRLRALRNVLADEILARPALARRLAEWREWQKVEPEARVLAFGVLTLTTLGSLWLLARAAASLLRASSVSVAARRLLAAPLLLVATFQLCSLPLAYGVAVARRDFPVVRIVESSKVPALEGRRALLLGESGDRVYFYQGRELFTLHVVAASAVEDWRIESRGPALAWIATLDDLRPFAELPRSPR